MNLEIKTYTLLLLISSVLLITTVIVLLRKKDAPGAMYLILAIIASFIYTNGYIIEVNAENLSTKFLGAQIQYFFGIPFIPIFWYASAKSFSTMKKYPGIKEMALIAIIPVITMCLLLTNESHQLMYKNMRIGEYGAITSIVKDWGEWYYIHVFYTYTMLGLGGYYLLISTIKSKGIFRKQSLFFLLMLLLPLMASLIYVFKILPGMSMDITPVFYSFASIIAGLNIQKHGIFDLIPAARDLVIESMANGIIVLDSNQRVIDANTSAKNIFSEEEIIGKSIEELFKFSYIKADIKELLQLQISEIEINNSIYELIIREIQQSKNSHGKILTLYNITERKKTEEKLRELNSAKDKFFSIIAHDLKNPFTGLIGLSQLLYDDFDEFNDQEKKQYIKEINELSGNTHRMLENLLSWSRQHTGRMEFSPEIFNITNLVRFNINNAGQQAKIKQINLAADGREQINVFADYNMVDTVLRNLVSNSIKFTQPGGIIRVCLKVTENRAEISVEDNGIGIDEKTQKKLFMIDCDVKSIGTAGEQGTGLGLLLCKEFIEKNGGTINVESSPGRGSTFTFSIPLSN